MPPTDPSDVRRLLRGWGREAHRPSSSLAALILVNAALAAGFAWGLTTALAGPRRELGLAVLAASLALRAAVAQAAEAIAARHARRATSLVRRRVIGVSLGRQRGERAALGEALATAVDEVEALDGYFRRYEPAAREARFAPIAIAAAVALASPASAAILLFTLIPFAAVMALAGGAAARESQKQFDALSRLSGLFVDRVRALPAVLAFAAEAREADRVAQAARDVSRRTLAVLRIAFVSSAGLEFFAALAVAMVAVYCGFSLLGLLPFHVPETLDFRRAFFALALAPEFYAPLRRLAGAYHERQIGEAAAARIAAVLAQAKAETVADAAAPEAPPEIRLRALRVRAGDGIIGPIDAVARPLGITALVGATGSGKSSVLAALAGLAPLADGVIEVDGRPAPVGLSSRAVAWAGQAPVFAPGTVAENLTAGAPGASRSALEMAVRQVGLEAALAARPLGLDTPIDERGSGFSGGERRRLALARALLKPAPLLILDEPTADLDPMAETEVIELLRSAARSRTVILATHSVRLAEAADVKVELA